MPLILEELPRLSEADLEARIAALDMSELEGERRKLNDHIATFPTVDDPRLEICFLAALARVTGRCRARNAGPKASKPPAAPKVPKASTASLLSNI